MTADQCAGKHERAGYTIVKGAEVEISARIARANKTLRGDRR